MNKEQQIKEITMLICECVKDGLLNTEWLAYKLYNAGYRKTFMSDLASNKQKAFKEGYQKGVNDTIEEFAERVKQAFYYEFDELIPSIMADKIDELLKEYEQ